MPEYLTPGVYYEPLDAPPLVRGVRTDIAGFVGLAERGPLDEAVRVESWRQFQSQFGGFVHYGYLAYAVKGFFENDGRTCFVVRVAGSTAARSSLTLKNAASKNAASVDVVELTAADEGTWGDRVCVGLLTQPGAGTFSLVITRAGTPDREVFARLSPDPAHKNFFARVINEGDARNLASRWVRARVPDSVPAGADLMPDALASGMKRGRAYLKGGRDGLASLTKDDFLGDDDPLATRKKGLGVLERVDAVAMVCVPDIHIRPAPPPPVIPPPKEPPHDPCRPRTPAPPADAVPLASATEQPPAFTDAEIEDVQRAMIEHCERLRDRVALLDVPTGAGGRALTVGEAQQWRSRFDSQRGFAALYHPWVKVFDPLRTAGKSVRAVPASGHVAGLCARLDLSVGVHRAPANQELFWAEDVTAEVSEEAQGLLNPDGVNCLRPFPGRGIRVYGARTVSSDPDWRYLNVRRLLLMIEEAVDEATQWAVFEPHDFVLRETLVRSVSGFLETVWRQGALVGETPRDAFYVKCDDQTNPPSSVDAGRVVTEVGVAPTRPAEFIVFRVGRTFEELEIVER